MLECIWLKFEPIWAPSAVSNPMSIKKLPCILIQSSASHSLTSKQSFFSSQVHQTKVTTQGWLAVSELTLVLSGRPYYLSLTWTHGVYINPLIQTYLRCPKQIWHFCISDLILLLKVPGSNLKKTECYFKKNSVKSKSKARIQTSVPCCYFIPHSQTPGEVDLNPIQPLKSFDSFTSLISKTFIFTKKKNGKLYWDNRKQCYKSGEAMVMCSYFLYYFPNFRIWQHRRCSQLSSVLFLSHTASQSPPPISAILFPITATVAECKVFNKSSNIFH